MFWIHRVAELLHQQFPVEQFLFEMLNPFASRVSLQLPQSPDLLLHRSPAVINPQLAIHFKSVPSAASGEGFELWQVQLVQRGGQERPADAR